MKIFKIITAALILMVIAFSSCKKETLATVDDIPPIVSLALSAEDTMQNLFFRSDSLVLGKVNMKPNTKYNYIIAIYDTSGIKSALYSLTKEYYLTYEFTSAPNPYYFNHPSNYYYSYNDTLLGGSYTRYLLSGSFTTPPVTSAIPIDFVVNAYDYNSSLGFLNIHCEVNDTPDEERWGWINL